MPTKTTAARRSPKSLTADAVTFIRPSTPVELSANARTVLRKRYLKKDASGAPVEEEADMFWRVALTIAQAKAAYGASPADIQAAASAFYDMMVQRFWEPNSPTLMNAGRPLGQLSACFVLPVEDAIANGTDGIYDTLTSMAVIHQSGGGTGFSFSRLRHKNAMVRSTTGVASGPVSFMKLYNDSTEVVKQGGTRRGANMGILRVDHPDILEFIDCKQDTTQIVNFNISVGITTRFMEALMAGASYDLVDHNGTVTGQLDAGMVFDKIVANAWATGEPGVFFIDEANKYNPVPHLGAYEATNPCGEQPLLAFDVCNLGSINLGRFVTSEDRSLPWQERIDWTGLKHYAKLSTDFLDLVIDANNYPLPQIDDLSKRIRRIGNGIMGYADLFVRLGVGYGTDEAVAIGGAIAKFFYEACQEASEEIAQERGVFPEWERSIWGPDATCARDANGQRIRPMKRLRNCNVNTVAPTGTISMIANCSGGLEPLFAVAFMRNQAGVMMPDVNEDFVRIAKRDGWYSEDLMTRIATEGHIHFPEVPQWVQDTFHTAHDVTPEFHVKHQVAWQPYVDSAISKTTNFPKEATKAQVRQIYLQAYAGGAKGVTVYRDGSRDGQVLSTGATQSAPSAAAAIDTEELETLKRALLESEEENLRLRQASAAQERKRTVRERPDELPAKVRRIETPLGTMFVTVTFDPHGMPFEVFASLGKAGGAAMADVEAICRLASLALRGGIGIQEIHKQLRGISSDKVIGFGPHKVLSVPDAIAQAIEQMLKEREGVQQELPLAGVTLTASHKDPDTAFLICPECKTDQFFQYTGNCPTCGSCGWSKC